jgi:hypothetical protein
VIGLVLDEGQRTSGDARGKRRKAPMTKEVGDPGKAKECQISYNLPALSESRGEVHQRIEASPAEPGKNLE